MMLRREAKFFSDRASLSFNYIFYLGSFYLFISLIALDPAHSYESSNGVKQ